jgi:hypothetical protein
MNPFADSVSVQQRRGLRATALRSQSPREEREAGRQPAAESQPWDRRPAAQTKCTAGWPQNLLRFCGNSR